MSNKKILFIVDDYLPSSIKVAAKMMHDLATTFVKEGNEVTVLTPLPKLKKSFEIKYLDDVEIIYFKSGEIKNTSKIKRAINESMLSYFAWRNCKEILKSKSFDGIVYYSPSIFFGSLVGRLKKLWNVKSYLILRDVFPQWTVDNGLIKENSLIHKYFQYFEKINYDNANLIGVMSQANKTWFNIQFDQIYSVEVLPNWTKIAKKEQVKPTHRKRLLLEGKVVFFYGGNIGHAQNMQILIDLAVKMRRNSKAHFLFVGKGDEVELILRQKKEFYLDNVTYLEPVNQNVYFEMLSEFDVGLFNLHPGHKTHNFPGKLLGYMEYKKPILGCVNTGNDLKEMINEVGAGYVFDYENSDKLKDMATNLVESEELREKMGGNGFELLQQNFNVKSTVKKIDLLFNSKEIDK